MARRQRSTSRLNASLNTDSKRFPRRPVTTVVWDGFCDPKDLNQIRFKRVGESFLPQRGSPVRTATFPTLIKDLISLDLGCWIELKLGWGTQCVGTDAGSAGGMNPPFPAHNLIHKANRYGLASLCNLDKLPPKGAVLIAAPLKIEGHRKPCTRARACSRELRWRSLITLYAAASTVPSRQPRGRDGARKFRCERLCDISNPPNGN